MIDFTTTTASGQTDPSGTYWSWLGVKEQIGVGNAAVESDLDNDQSPSSAVPDMARVIADGTKADAYTEFRARRGSKPRTEIPIPESDPDFSVIQQATDLYTCYLLVTHRDWPTITEPDVRDRAKAGLYNRAMLLYEEIFGAVETNDPNKPKPGTLIAVPMNFDPICNCDEFGNC